MRARGLASQRSTNIIAICALIVAVVSCISAVFQYWLATDQENKQLRAYLVNSNMVSTFKPDTQGGQFYFAFYLKNFGQTPTIDIHVRYDAITEEQPAGAILGDPNKDGVSAPNQAPRRLTQGSQMLAPGQETGRNLFFTATKEEIKDILELKRLLVLWGTFYYKDIFGKKHSGRFCFFYDTRAVDNKSPYRIKDETGGRCDIDETPDLDIGSYP